MKTITLENKWQIDEDDDIEIIEKKSNKFVSKPGELLISQCIDCKHKLKGKGCKAFPLEIPQDILLNRHDHQKPYPGDHGIRYEKEL